MPNEVKDKLAAEVAEVAELWAEAVSEAQASATASARSALADRQSAKARKRANDAWYNAQQANAKLAEKKLGI